MKAGIALLMIDIPDLSGGGGAERFFADFFQKYHEQIDPQFDLYFLTDASEINLQKINKLEKFRDKLIYFKDYRFSLFNHITKKIPFINGFTDVLRKWVTVYKLNQQMASKNIKLCHITVYAGSYYFLINALRKISYQPKLVLNIVDCRIPSFYFNENVDLTYRGANKITFQRLFQTIKLDGIFSWYQNFIDFANQNKLIPNHPLFFAIKSRFTSLENINTDLEKENVIIFAGRLDDQKKPLMFLNAIKDLCKSNSKVLSEWKVKVFGKGPLKDACTEFINEHQLGHIVSMNESSKMADHFLKSKLFVSTQDFENFPSLSMAEAMACGNAIIARNVGQTNYFLEDGRNGYMAAEDGSDLSKKIETYILSSDTHAVFSDYSKQLIKDKHNVRNFIMQTDHFWNEVLSI